VVSRAEAEQILKSKAKSEFPVYWNLSSTSSTAITTVTSFGGKHAGPALHLIRESTLSVTGSCRYGVVMELSCVSDLGARGQYCSFIKISRIGTGFPRARPEPLPSMKLVCMKLVCVLRDAIAHGGRRMTASASPVLRPFLWYRIASIGLLSRASHVEPRLIASC
jgi:hypothetical protein